MKLDKALLSMTANQLLFIMTIPNGACNVKQTNAVKPGL